MSRAPRLGFLGPGVMGGPMATRLLLAGYDVTVWGRTPVRVQPLVDLGGHAAERPTDVLVADVVLGCLLDTDVVRHTYLGADGLADHARGGQVFVEHGTFDPALAVEISQALSTRGAAFVDAPVSGGPGGAAAGTLVAMAGGDAEVVSGLGDVLSHYCGRIVHAGTHGRGLMLKLVNQLLVATHAVAAAEASALVARVGIDPAAAHDALMGGWAASRMLERHMPQALAGDFDGDGSGLSKFIEVIDLVDRFLASALLPSELLPAVGDVFRSTVSRGHGEESFAALITHYGPHAAHGE